MNHQDNKYVVPPYNAYALIMLDLTVISLGTLVLIYYMLGFLYKIVKSEKNYTMFEWEIDPCELYIQENNSNEEGVEENYTQTAYFRGNMVAIKPIHDKTEINRNDIAIMTINHPNIIETVGFCVLYDQVMKITPYHDRGSLEDMLMDAEFNLDNLLKISMMENLLDALCYVEKSEFEYHGKLKPSNCLIDKNWVLRVSDVGLSSFALRTKDEETNEFDENFIAPEISKILIVDRVKYYNSLCDVYSFGKILRLVFQLDNSIPVLRDLYKGDICYISQYGTNTFVKYNAQDFMNDLEDISYICLRNDPSNRMYFNELNKLFKGIIEKIGCNSEENMLERVINQLIYTVENTDMILKQSINHLHNYVEKYNILLDETFPKSVSKVIRSCQKYEPKYVNMVTMMFLDIPDFNSVCDTITPFEIVSYLNEIHNHIDRIIDKHRVYKLETIGDAYVVVAGLIEAIDDEGIEKVTSTIQVERILQLAIEITNEFLTHKLKGNVRIGIHSGPVTAGITGCLSPRFCLFGDTMNTASRMKSSAGQFDIILSEVSKNYISESDNCKYNFEERIDNIKGKGTMKIYRYF